MTIEILDENFERVEIVDYYESFIWTTRHCSYGDFELHASASDKLMNYTDYTYFIRFNNSDDVMLIEDKTLTSEFETGPKLTITGRSLMSILTRRIVWKQTIVEGTVQACVRKLLNENLINPTDTKRRIPNFVMKDSTDPAITSLTMKAQFTGDSLYDAIVAICAKFELSVKMEVNSNNQIQLSLYKGKDRTYDQSENDQVVFSPEFDNLRNSEFVESISPYKTIALVAGEGEGTARRTKVAGSETESGLERRELFVDARDLSSETEDGQLPDATYMAQLENRGLEKLAENSKISAFSGEVESNREFVLGVHYNLGDMVQIVNEFGMMSKSRVIEIVETIDMEGRKTYPTFSSTTEAQ